MKRLAAIASLMLFLTPSPLHAQTGAYIAGGWTESYRESGDILQSPTDTIEKSFVPGISATGGVWFTNGLAIEGGVTYLRAQSFPWYFSYAFAGGTTSEIAHDSDLPLTVALRGVIVRSKPLRLDVIGGGGFNLHRGSSDTVGRCGSFFVQLPCTPVSPPVESDSLSTLEPTLMFGADAPIPASRRVSIVPSFRVYVISRRQWLTGYNHRGPTGGNGLLTTFGVGVMFGRRAQ